MRGIIWKHCVTSLGLMVLGAGLLAADASASGLSFSTPLKLPNSPPKGSLPGGEPSVAFEGDGRHVYVVAPGGGENGGVGFWRSADGGRHFLDGKSLGSLIGGGDSDVSVGPNDVIYVADLELAANALCRSHDHGKTFDSNCDTGIATNQTGVDSDREWVTPSPTDPSLVYFSYHDFATETPLVYRSDSGGDPGSFVPCGPVLAPGGQAQFNYLPGGTNVGKPAIAGNGGVYVPMLEPDAGDTYLDPYDHLYVAIAPHGCDGSTIFHDVAVYGNPNANLANIFPYVVNAGHGTLYAAVTGVVPGHHLGVPGGADHFGVYLFRSTDRGKHWSSPIRVDPRAFKANALASLTPGPRPGDVGLGFYRTGTSDPNSDKAVWRFEVASSTDFGHHFSYERITPDPIHYGQICNLGILCTGGRNLLDFSSVGVNPRTGCLIAVFAGDPYDTPSNGNTDEAAPYVSRQKAGCF